MSRKPGSAAHPAAAFFARAFRRMHEGAVIAHHVTVC